MKPSYQVMSASLSISETTPLFESRESEPSTPFAFHLCGILPLPESLPRGEDIRISARLVNSIATALPPGVRAIFHHRRTSVAEIEWTLEGEENCADSTLTTTLDCALATSGGVFRFERREPFDFERLPHRVRLRPTARLLPIHCPVGIGFGAAIGIAPVKVLRLPATGRLPAKPCGRFP